MYYFSAEQGVSWNRLQAPVGENSADDGVDSDVADTVVDEPWLGESSGDREDGTAGDLIGGGRAVGWAAPRDWSFNLKKYIKIDVWFNAK